VSIKNGNYFTVQAFMRNNLNLKGNELLIYAIIFGFSQVENQYFTGSLNYLAEWTGISSKTTVMTILNSLISKGLLEKEEIYNNGIKFCKYKALIEPKEIDKVDEVIKKDIENNKKNISSSIQKNDVKNCEGISKIDMGISKIDMGVYQKLIRGISKIDNNKIDIIHKYNNHIIEEDDVDFIKIKNWFAENKIDFSKKHQEIILKLLENNSVAYLLKVFQDEINILKNNPAVKNINAIFSYHLFNGTVQIDMKEIEKKEIEITSKKTEEKEYYNSFNKTLEIFNNLSVKDQEEIENKILNLKEIDSNFLLEVKKNSKLFYYRLIGDYLKRELTIKGVI
jgi:putative uncharacterized protein FNV2249